MKKRYPAIFFVILLASALMLSSCGETLEYYTVTFDLNGGTAVTPIQNRAVEKGNTFSKPDSDPVKEGYNFMGWYAGDVKWNFDSDTVSTDLSLKAKWERIVYTVAFDSDGAGEVGSQEVAHGDFAPQPDTPEKTGFAFLGWYLGEEKWNFDTDTVTSNITLKAKWVSTLNTVIFDSQGGSSVDSVTVNDGGLVTKPADPEKANSVFLGWYLGNKEWNFDTDTVTEDITLTAMWDTTITVTFDSDGGSSRAAVTLDAAGLVTQPFPPSREGHRFLGWYNGEVLWDFENDIAQDNIVLTAHWQECETYKIEFDANGGSKAETIYVPVGEMIPLPPSPTKNSCKLLWWEYYSEETEEWIMWSFASDIPTSDMKLVAYWSLPIHVPQ